MRFPALSDLDREQRRIYAEAPNDGAIVVIGAPGTGKTVMAFHRAQKLRELGQRPHVIMFGSVLERYTSSGQRDDARISTSTMHAWAKHWWQAAFRKWPPRPVGSQWDWDWPSICAQAISADPNAAKALDWGHLIIDEGQDFPLDMYVTLGLLTQELGTEGARPQITVFADDNQRLQVDKNSETAGIRKSLFVEKDPARNFVLKKNFRNTAEIARFAAHFQVGQPSGKAELPDRHGDLPAVLLCGSDQDLSDFIARKVKSSPGKQVGVIVHGASRKVTQTYNRLSARIKDGKAKVQMYVNGDKNRTAKLLDFSSTDTVTVLHQASAKGLEFDIVFFVGLQRVDLSSSGGVNERMALYVMCSRARAELFLAFYDLDPTAPLPPATALLPPPNRKLCRYVGLGRFESAVDDALSRVEWIDPIIDAEEIAE